MLIKANWQEPLARYDQSRKRPKHRESFNEWMHLHRAMEKLRLLCPESSENSNSRLTESLKQLALSVPRKLGHRHPQGTMTTGWESARRLQKQSRQASGQVGKKLGQESESGE